MAQKRRKDSKIMSFLIPLKLLAEVDEALVTQQRNTRQAPLSGRSEWIIRALKRELDHSRRSRRSKRNGNRTEKANDATLIPPADAGDRGVGVQQPEQLRADGAYPGGEGWPGLGSGPGHALGEGAGGEPLGGEARHPADLDALVGVA